MTSYESLSRLFILMTFIVNKGITSLMVLDPAIKAFIEISAIIGPLSITALILLLKQIKKSDPNRIRWK
tara:strand:- start:138 stop:344 length:207 start_codon:yes stop_codon:yes gene_type:complete